MTRWYQEKKQEHFYKKAKKEGYRARSAYKLKQLQKKFNIISPGDTVVDLGAAPGGWSQVAKELVGSNGLIVGIDLQRIKPIQGIIFFKGDITEQSSLTKIKQSIGSTGAQVVISDMAPNISGNYSIDHARSIYLSQQAFHVAEQLLADQGNFICKIFEGELLAEFISTVKNRFKSIKRISPQASRKSSSELYLIGKSFIRS